MERHLRILKEHFALRKIGKEIKKLNTTARILSGNANSTWEDEYRIILNKYYSGKDISIEILRKMYRVMTFLRKTSTEIILNFGLGLATGMTVGFFSEDSMSISYIVSMAIIAFTLVYLYRKLPELYYVHSEEPRRIEIECEVLEEIINNIKKKDNA